MSATLALDGAGRVTPGARTSPWSVTVTRMPAAAEAWRTPPGRGVATPFQGATWLDAWRETVGQASDVEPFLVEAVDRAGGALAMALPLVRRRAGGMSLIECPDRGVTDYNAPVIGPAAPTDPAGARALWAALVAALPAADRLQLTKMPASIDGIGNPLASLPAARPSRLCGNVVTIDGPYEAYLASLERVFRKELRRSLRVFEKSPGARFERIADTATGLRVLAGLEDLQRDRIREKGLDYVLDAPENAALYRRLITSGLDDGRTVLTALMAGDIVVAALLGIVRHDTFAMVRLGAAGGAWRGVSPGRLVIERTMHALHAEGFRHFDFTIGQYDYKRRLGVVPRPLVEIDVALSWRGVAPVQAARARAALRQSPVLRAIARRVGRRPATLEA